MLDKIIEMLGGATAETFEQVIGEVMPMLEKVKEESSKLDSIISMLDSEGGSETESVEDAITSDNDED